MKTPSRGPDVAEVTNIEDSMTPSSMPIPKEMPMIIKAKTTPMNLILHNCLASFMPFRQGRGRTKSSNATVASEFKFETFKLQEKYISFVENLRWVLFKCNIPNADRFGRPKV